MWRRTNNADQGNQGNQNQVNQGDNEQNSNEPSGDKNITLAYVAWDSEIASTNVVATILEERLGYNVNMLQVDNGPMWQGIADGSADAMVAAWLPGTHGNFYEGLKDSFEDLGPNLEGAAIGLVVPTYMDITSIEDLAIRKLLRNLMDKLQGSNPARASWQQQKMRLLNMAYRI